MACLWSCGHTSKVRPILDRAEMCMESHPDSAFVALDYYASIGDSENTQKARACLDRINENASLLAPSDTLKIQNARIIEERYSDKMTLVKKDERMRDIIILSILALCPYS